jgi:hypothetical protein
LAGFIGGFLLSFFCLFLFQGRGTHEGKIRGGREDEIGLGHLQIEDRIRPPTRVSALEESRKEFGILVLFVIIYIPRKEMILRFEVSIGLGHL